jgi:hypothetical protein
MHGYFMLPEPLVWGEIHRGGGFTFPGEFRHGYQSKEKGRWAAHRVDKGRETWLN